MSTLATLYIKVDVLKTLADTVAKKGEKGVEFTISINDETNQFGQNISAYVSQTKEQRDEKKPKFYTGNGKVVWTDGNITVAAKQDTPTPATGDDLPF